MASSITAADLTVTITESVTLAGSDRGASHTLTISDVTETDNRIVNVGTSQTDIIGFGTSNSQGQFIRTDVKYIRFTNKDDTNYIILGMSKNAADTAYFKLEAGKSMMFGNDDIEVSAGGSSFSSFEEADAFSAQANGSACDLEYFVALT